MDRIRLVSLLCSTISLCSSLELPPDGFWFNCGVDFCEFPVEYCRVLEGQRPSCHACTQSECYSLDTPSQCYTRCKELERGGHDDTSTNTMKGAMLGNSVEGESTIDRLSSLTDENKSQWIVITILVVVIVVAIILLVVILITALKTRRTLVQHIKAGQEETKLMSAGQGPDQTSGPQQHTPQQQTGPDPGVNDDLHAISVVSASGANGMAATVGCCREEEEPLLPRNGNKCGKPEGKTLCQPTERSGNVESQFSSKLMDDGSDDIGRYTEESPQSPPIEIDKPIIAHPIEEHRASNPADCILIDRHNMRTSAVNVKNSSSKRHSASSEETTIKQLESDQDEEDISPQGVTQVQYRPCSGLISSLSSDNTSGTSDSGHYSTGYDSTTGSLDLKNHHKHKTQVTEHVISA
ncbi:uncharacterized protein [Argopecten irradians]|uniref:uncharacterized protein n=1 Tax=Argopecten irradians TaxID=31199 RepID=UPI003714802B